MLWEYEVWVVYLVSGCLNNYSFRAWRAESGEKKLFERTKDNIEY